MSKKTAPKGIKYDFPDIKRRRARGQTLQEIALSYGVTRGAITEGLKRYEKRRKEKMKQRKLAETRTNPLEKYENFSNQTVQYVCDLPEDHLDYYVEVEGA